MGLPALKVEDYFPADVPSFDLPQFPLEGAIDSVLATLESYSEKYFSERESMVRDLEDSMGKLVQLAEKFSLNGGPPDLEALIAIEGNHLEKIRGELEPKIAQVRFSGKESVRSRHPKVKAVMTSLVDRNNRLMGDYIRVVEETYQRLIALRDESIRKSYSALADEVLMAVWGDDDL